MGETDGKKIFDLLKEISNLLNKRTRQYFSQWGLTTPQILALSALDEYKEMKISDIANYIGMADSNVSGVIDRLEKVGLVERVRSIDDRRIVKVKLMPQYEELKKNFNSKIEDYFSMLLSGSSQIEMNEIIFNLERLKNLVKNNGNVI